MYLCNYNYVEHIWPDVTVWLQSIKWNKNQSRDEKICIAKHLNVTFYLKAGHKVHKYMKKKNKSATRV